jgi:phenylalanyl-tRNA synthetase alpha subunit
MLRVYKSAEKLKYESKAHNIRVDLKQLKDEFDKNFEKLKKDYIKKREELSMKLFNYNLKINEVRIRK